jgi:hypothetical protein
LGHLDERGQEVAQALREWQEHLASTEVGAEAEKKKAAFERLAHETAFTVLNRLAALRMCEERGHVIECVRRGMESDGFVLYERFSGGALGSRGETYRVFLERMVDELAVDLGALFDRRVPQSLVFPRERCLEEVLVELNKADLAHLWKEDETIGWVYQYFNSKEEREKMREESAAPRNSRELAVRNQFFTPRYVVEFLVDNTLGRIWYEMLKGTTSLADSCRYLVRRKHPFFLRPDEKPPEPVSGRVAGSDPGVMWAPPPSNETDLRAMLQYAVTVNGYEYSKANFKRECADLANERLGEYRQTKKWRGTFEELRCCLFFEQRRYHHFGYLPQGDEAVAIQELFKAVCEQRDFETEFIPHRPKKDPRDLKILDPACGSGHFLLYCFDLLETIYEEAWTDESPMPSEATGKSLREEFPELDSLKKALPELILRHNLHGIDIDLRACQIAALALWLRAQRSYQRLGLRGADRPKITKSNVACAEPMPGEKTFLEQFIAGLQPRVIGQLVKVVFEKMKLAGEAGSLLKIEEEIAGAVAEAKKQWLAGPKVEQQRLFAEDERPEQRELGLDFSGITDAAFWERAEERIYGALQAYSEQVENGHGYQRRLFADDAARGFAFIDVCRKRYDVVLMNPPFGEVGLPSRDYLYREYSHATQDIFSAFVDRGVQILKPAGTIGAITTRLAFYLELLEDWRTKLFTGEAQLSLMADLGYGVLEAALVEAAAYVIMRHRSPGNLATFISALSKEDKGGWLLQSCISLSNGRHSDASFSVAPGSFTTVPASRAAYWVSQKVRDMFRSPRNVESVYGFPFVGFQTGDDEFFLRLAWEVPPADIGGIDSRWATFAKGGEYAQFFGDYHLLVNWSARQLARRSSNPDAYFKPGVTYTERTTSNLSARILPGDCVFSPNGVTIVPSPDRIYECAALLNSQISQLLIEVCVGGGDAVYSGSAARHYGPRIVARIPVPRITSSQAKDIAAGVLSMWNRLRNRDAGLEPGRFFVSPFFPDCRPAGVRELADQRQVKWEDDAIAAIDINHRLDRLLAEAADVDDTLATEIRREAGAHPAELPNTPIGDIDRFRGAYLASIDVLVDRAVQTAGASRSLTKKTYVVDRQIELLSQLFGAHPSAIVQARRRLQLKPPAAEYSFSDELVSYSVGAAFGRWDIRFATGEKPAPELPDPFAPLPACSPGMLQNERGLPLTEGDVRRLQATGQWNYLIEIPWDGILVDDPGPEGTQPHRNDIVRRVQAVLTAVWKDRAEVIEQEAYEILGVKDLREYFRKLALFFADHLKRYSKSRRQAPIYWPLSTSSGSYTLWIYYHRLNDQTLYTALNKYVKPKFDAVEKELRRIELELPKAMGREASKQREAFEETSAFLEELRELRDELQRVAGLPYKPNLNDGVLITASPLWKLFRLPKWRKDLEECWNKLYAGEYDWAHLAYSIWPDRVREVCKRDRSIAIAHGLEGLCEVQAKPTMKARSRRQKGDVEQAVLKDED